MHCSRELSFSASNFEFESGVSSNCNFTTLLEVHDFIVTKARCAENICLIKVKRCKIRVKYVH